MAGGADAPGGSAAARVSPREDAALFVAAGLDDAVDQQAFRDLVEWQISEGTNGLVPVGTTGESPTLSHDEHKQVVEWCVDQAKGRVPVIAGAGSNSTREAIELVPLPRREPVAPVAESRGRWRWAPWAAAGGAVVNLASMSAFMPVPGTGVYSMSKAALEMLARPLVIERS